MKKRILYTVLLAAGLTFSGCSDQFLQGLMYPCKHLYLNALPLASIKKPRDWHV